MQIEQLMNLLLFITPLEHLLHGYYIVQMPLNVIHLKAFGVRKTPIDFGVNKSKVKVTCTLRSRLLELKNWFLEPNFRLPS